MKTNAERSREQTIREKAQRLGYRLTKRRGNIGLDNFGEYMLVWQRYNSVVMGDRYDASLDQIKEFLEGEQASR